ncbi:hypothetical protein OG524_22710 [Streptomyces sp. NBC_01520]|uniref:hypothetical protein n=1 Tax=Streptomyces sp. NBC_01520 TaxID=2903892 RepID=UPI0038671358
MRNTSQRQPKAPQTPELAALLAAAQRAGALDADDELRATTAFLAARDEGAHASVSPWRRRRRHDWRPAGRRGGVRSVRVMLGGFVAAATLGGVAVATGSGVIPTPFGDGGQKAPDAVQHTQVTPTTPGGRPSGEAWADGGGSSKGATDTSGGARPTDGPGRARDEAELCRVYIRDRGNGKATDATVFERLEAAAGEASETAVAAYCDTLVGRPSPGRPTSIEDAPDGNRRAEEDGPPVSPEESGSPKPSRSRGGPAGAG